MEKTKANGQTGHAVPAAVGMVAMPKDPAPTSDPFDQVKSVFQKMGNKRYAEGYKRAASLIARGVGQLDGDAKTKLVKVCDMLETELHEAEQAAQ
jgi:hypothetical protein